MKKPYPTIAVHFMADGDELLNVTLSLALKFSFVIQDGSATLTALLTTWVENYLQKKAAPFPIIPIGTPFQQTVWKQLTLIPFGSTLSYGQVATHIGNPNAYRAVGSACNKNSYPFLIPCHRVVQAEGKLGGFEFDIEIKKKLLEFERGGSPSLKD